MITVRRHEANGVVETTVRNEYRYKAQQSTSPAFRDTSYSNDHHGRALEHGQRGGGIRTIVGHSYRPVEAAS